MNASETKLQPIIEGTKQYVVPLFQREYSWDKKEWSILWDDLVELCEAENPRDHFIGSIVTMPTNTVPEGVAKFLLIDGQQRLTTIFILLAVLRDKAKQNSQEALAAEINNTLLVNPYKDGLDYYKLQPTQTDRASFQELIRSGQSPGENQINSAYEFFERKMRQSGIDGQTIKKVVSNNLSVVSIVLAADDNPHLVFESLNAKGRPLTQADLIRNYFFMRIHVNEQDETYNQLWKPMQDALGDSLTECIRHYLMKDSSVIKQSDVYFSLKERVSKSEAMAYLKDLARFASYYQKLLQPEREANLEIRRSLLRLNRIEVTTAYPFLLNCYDEYDQGSLSSAEFVSILKVIENFVIRRFVCNVPTSQLLKIFVPLYGQVRNKHPESFVEELKDALQTKNYPRDGEFKSRLTDAKLYGGGDRRDKTKIILEALEESYEHKEQVPFTKLSIEHVMPQTPTEWWQNHLGEDWEMTHELSLHTLGNLTLTAYNSELSNDSYASKKERLRESHLEINKYFDGKQSWRREEIEERAEALANIALNVWPYFGTERPLQSNQGRVTGKVPRRLSILGQVFSVESWRDVLEQTMNAIAEVEPEKFELLAEEFPRFVGRDKTKFRAMRELSNGAFVEVHLSAQDIQRFCLQAVEAIDLTTEDWIIETA